MSKYCTKCGIENSNSSNYCSNCGTSLDSSSNSNSSYSSSYSYDAPEGCVYDHDGHVRPDPYKLRQDEERLRESFRDRM